MRTRRTVWVADPGGGADRLVKRKRVVMGARPTLFTCLRCRQDKVACDRRFPCGRCFSRSFTCEVPAEVLVAEKPTSTLHMILSRSEPLAYVECFMRVFERVRREHKLCTTRTKAILSSWRGMSFKAGRDVSFGIINEMQRVVGLSAIDLQQEQELLTDQPLSPLSSDDDELMRRRLLESPTYSLLDDGVTPTIVTLLHEGRMAVVVSRAGLLPVHPQGRE